MAETKETNSCLAGAQKAKKQRKKVGILASNKIILKKGISYLLTQFGHHLSKIARNKE